METFLWALHEYKLDLMVPAYSKASQKRFEERSTYRWAVDELENYVLSHINEEPIDACMMFIRQMSYYRRRYPKWRAMCGAAMEVADEMIDILMTENSLARL